MQQIQDNLYKKALTRKEEKTYKADTFEEFKSLIEKGGFVWAHWDGTSETEEKIKQQSKATIRCTPIEKDEELGKCVLSGKASNQRVLFAKSY